MELKRISFRNYKAFKNNQELEIKPITILIGKNSSGKSVVSRLPLLLAKSLNDNSNSPIELEFDGLEFGGAFKDLVHNKIEHGNITFELEFKSNENYINLLATIQNIADSPIQFISEYSLKSNLVNIDLNYILDEESNVYGKTKRYKASGDFEGLINISFRGLLIDKMNADDTSLDIVITNLGHINSEIKKCISKIDYIGPFRSHPVRDYIFKGSMPNSIGYSGEYAPHILSINDYLDKNLKKSVGEWYKNILGGWQLDVNKIGDKFEIVLISPDDPNVKINLKDVGHGMSQVLPLIVRSFLKTDNQNGIMIIEQPELHLHPAAHGDLAELFSNIIKKEKSKWIIETHSEVFILRIRRLIAEKKINSDDVAIYWVNDEERPGSNLMKITVDKEGEVDFWPEDIFTEDYKEVLALRKAQNK